MSSTPPFGLLHVDRAVGVKEKREAGFAHRPRGGDERWDGVGGATTTSPVDNRLALRVGSHVGKDIGAGAGSAGGRLRVASTAQSRLEAWAETRLSPVTV